MKALDPTGPYRTIAPRMYLKDNPALVDHVAVYQARRAHEAKLIGAMVRAARAKDDAALLAAGAAYWEWVNT